jgi:protein-disulfide isomerase
VRKLFLIVVLTAISLSACSGQGTGSNTPQATTVNLPVTPTPETACRAIKVEPTPGPEVPSIFPAVESSDWVQGPSNAAITVVEYGDFQ